MTVLPEQARLAVLGEPEALERLGSALAPGAANQIALVPLGGLLADYDPNTLEGEAARRQLERLYASLRGRLLVRLLVVDLNPESVAAAEHCALERAAEQWEEIETRLESFLDERAYERIEFVTAVVVEQGDLIEAHRPFLETLAGSARRSDEEKAASSGRKARPRGGGSSRRPGIRRRAYLMTRSLELGKSSVLFARDVWPEVVSGLLRHFLWGLREKDAGTDGDRVRMGHLLESEGVFAWRTTRILAAVDPDEIRSETSQIFARINADLLGRGEGVGTLFPALPPPSAATGEAFSSPVANALAAGPWNCLRAVAAAGSMASDPAWKNATAHYGSACREEAARAGEGIPSGDGGPPAGVAAKDIAAVKERRRAAEERPGLLFAEPGRDDEGDAAALSRAGIGRVRATLDSAAARRGQVEEWAREHDLAARAFAVASERVVVGLAVAMALFYPFVSIFWLAGRHLPGIGEDAWVAGAVLGGFAAAGAAAMLALGWALQRWRGRRAAHALAGAGKEWIEAEERVREAAASALRTGSALGEWTGRAMARELLRHRLRRAELVLQNELQLAPRVPHAQEVRKTATAHRGEEPPFSSENEEAGHRAKDLALAKRLVEVEIQASAAAGLEEAERERLVESIKSEFLREWRAFLSIDSGQVGFLPVAPLLALCEAHLSRACEQVAAGLREARARRVRASKKAVAKLRTRLAEGGDYFDGGTNFFSVDLSGGSPLDTVYHREGLSEAFQHRAIERLVELPDEILGNGVLGLWYGECRLRTVSNPKGDEGGPLTFESASDASAASRRD